ncbi:MAG: nuclear transport factor 2 family protein [Bacteroidetes bacterium]|nr:nuclear transport factor 2 family protein [Bacteroidota bacterium]
MKSLNSLLKEASLGLCVIALLTTGCASPSDTPAESANPDYAIASPQFSDLASEFLTSWAALDLDAWMSMMSEDVQFYFPDGDGETRTNLIGKAAVAEWWTNWKETSGIQSMTYRDHIDIPLNPKVTNPYSGLQTILVLSYFSNELVYTESTVNVRMNWAMYFDSDNQINRVYTYYDRTNIIQATGENVLTD